MKEFIRINNQDFKNIKWGIIGLIILIIFLFWLFSSHSTYDNFVNEFCYSKNEQSFILQWIRWLSCSIIFNTY